MSVFTISPNMNMPIPSVGLDPGPDWADNNNTCLTLIDQHNHSPGFGVPVQPNGLNINSDLPFNNNNATLLRSTRFSPQVSPIPNTGSDIGAVYVSGNELYYNDVNGGNQIQITNNGSVNAGAGSITGLPSGTASASFAAATFTFQSATNTAASVDGRNFILRNSSAGSNALTLQPPLAMGSSYSLTLPSVPVATSFVSLDTSGNFGAAVAVNGGITTTNISASAAIAATQLAAPTTWSANGSSGSFTSGSPVAVVTIPTFAPSAVRPAFFTFGGISLVGNAGSLVISAATSIRIVVYCGTQIVNTWTVNNSGTQVIGYPMSMFNCSTALADVLGGTTATMTGEILSGTNCVFGVFTMRAFQI